MATKSALTAALQARRTYNPYGNTGKIRLLSPSNNSIASISKSTAASELDTMVTKYNAGQISNEDMRAFLEKMSGNTALSQSDRQQIQTQLVDFDNKIQGDKLLASYKAAPDNSLAQVQAAEALANYYNTRASGQIAGTPAQSQNLQDAAEWEQRALAAKTNIQKIATQNLRYQEEAQVNAIPDNTSEQAYRKAEMYKALFDKANADDDAVNANKYAAYYQDAITKGDTLSQSEQVKGEKESLRQALNSYVDMYHDGKINETQYLQLLADISPRIDASNDYGLINQLNRTTDTIQKNLSKGGLKRGTTASGLPVVLGKAKGGGGSSTLTNYDNQDFDYSDNVRILQQALKTGKLGGKPYSLTEYQKDMAQVITEYGNAVQQRITDLESVAQDNPSLKIGRRKVSDILDEEYKKLDNLSYQIDAINSGDAVLVEEAPKQFNSVGQPISKPESKPTFSFMLKSDTLATNQYALDEDGVAHKIIKNERLLTPEEQSQYIQQGGITDTNGNYLKVRQDASGNYYVENGQSIRVYDPGSTKYNEVAPDSKGIVPSYSTTVTFKQQDKETADYLKAHGGKDLATQLGKNIQAKKESANQLAVPSLKDVGGIIGGTIRDTASTALGTINSLLGAAIKVGGNLINPAKSKASGESMPVKPTEAPKVVAPIRPVPVDQLSGVSSSTPISLPESARQMVPQTGTAYQPIKLPTLNIAGKVAPTPLQIYGKTQAPVQIQGLQGLKTTPKSQSLNPIQFFQQKILNPISKIKLF